MGSDTAFTITYTTEDGQQHRVSLAETPLVFGRSSNADVTIAATHLSRRHMQVEAEGPRVFITDLGSSNGTRLRGETIPSMQRMLWQPGDTVSISGITFTLIAPDTLPEDSVEGDTAPLNPDAEPTARAEDLAGIAAAMASPPAPDHEDDAPPTLPEGQEPVRAEVAPDIGDAAETDDEALFDAAYFDDAQGPADDAGQAGAFGTPEASTGPEASAGDSFDDPFHADPFQMDEPASAAPPEPPAFDVEPESVAAALPDESDDIDRVEEEVTTGDTDRTRTAPPPAADFDDPFQAESGAAEAERAAAAEMEPEAPVVDERQEPATATTGTRRAKDAASVRDAAAFTAVGAAGPTMSASGIEAPEFGTPPRVEKAPRHYDTATFTLLDPDNSDPRLRAFVQCTNCEALYHRVTWESQRQCTRCEGKQAREVSIPPPAALHVVQKPNALPIENNRQKEPIVVVMPGEPATESQTGGAPRSAAISQSIARVGLSTRNLVGIGITYGLALVLIALSFWVAVNSYRLVALSTDGELTASAALDVFLDFGAALPHSLIAPALAATVLAACAFYPHKLNGETGYPSLARRVVRIIAALQLLFIANMIFVEHWGNTGFLLRIDRGCTQDWEETVPVRANDVNNLLLFDTLSREDDFSQAQMAAHQHQRIAPPTCLLRTTERNLELAAEQLLDYDFALVQVTAVLAAFVTAFVFRASTRNRPEITPPNSRLVRFISMARFLTVSAGVIAMGTLLLILELQVYLNLIEITRIDIPGISIAVTFPMILAATAGVAVAALIYLPPPHKLFNKAQRRMRLVIIFLAVAAFAVTYSQYADQISSDVLDYLLPFTVLGAALMAVLLLPIQRTLS